MIVALHSPPSDFFETAPPHSNDELLRFVRRSSLLGFKAVQIGPLNDFVTIEGERLRTVLDSLGLERNLHVGGLYDTEKFALTEDEYLKARKEMHYGLHLCEEISSRLMSVHPPFFSAGSIIGEEIQFKARARFFEFLKKEVDFAGKNHIKIALESFCYHPFIFDGLKDFAQFV